MLYNGNKMMRVHCVFFFLGAVLLGLCVGQRAPCYTCEMLKNRAPAGEKLVEVKENSAISQRANKNSVRVGVCDSRCWCSASDSFSCLPGVKAVRDGCNCCMICPRQLGDHCDQRYICDSQRNLVCLHGACAVENSTHSDCFAGGVWYKSGVQYRLGCQRLCTCNNGFFICKNQCKHEKSPPLSCPNARLVKIENQCCREWMCDTYVLSHTVKSAVSTHDGLPEVPSPGTDYCEYVRGTDWSMCSQSCGWGQSLRYRDKRCKPDVRHCQIRPCDNQQSHYKRHIDVKVIPQVSRLRHTIKEKVAQYIEIDGCISTRRYIRKHCNNPLGKNCCHPTDVITKAIKMMCDSGSMVRRNVMFIRDCYCSPSCFEE